jgi:hypothetical protein
MKSTQQKERNKKLRTLATWTFTWVITMAIASFGPKYIWDHHTFLTPFAIVVNFVNGLLMIIANRDLFNHFDELERKIHLEATGFTLVLSVVAGLSYSLLDTTDLIPFDASIAILVMFMSITNLLAVIINSRRFA